MEGAVPLLRLAGVEKRFGGTILWREQPVEIKSVRDSAALGIATIHQELSLAPALSVAENLYLGAEAVLAGKLLATSAQFPKEIGKVAAEKAYDALAGKPVEKEVKVKVGLIDKSNAAAFLKSL